MDIKKLTSTLLSSDSINGLSDLTGLKSGDVSNVLTEALPALLGGANNQAKSSDTTESFANALTRHAKDDTSNLASFLGNVDLGDGAKIISHLLGSDQSSVTKAVAKKTGVSSSKIQQILSAVGPLLMSLLGKQADEDDDKDSGVGALLGSLLDNVDLGALLGTSSGTSEASSSNSKTGGLFSFLGKLLK